MIFTNFETVTHASQIGGKTFAKFSLFLCLLLDLSLAMCVNVRACMRVCICAHIVSMPNINTLQFVEFIFMGYAAHAMPHHVQTM